MIDVLNDSFGNHSIVYDLVSDYVMDSIEMMMNLTNKISMMNWMSMISMNVMMKMKMNEK